MSNPTEEDWKRIAKLVDSIAARSDAEPFREPVPWKELGLVDYPTVIRQPMDLGTVKKKIKDRKYENLFKVAEDMRLIWSNCMTYNADGSDFYKLAETLQKKWNDKYQKLLQDISSKNNSAAVDGTGGALADANSSSKSSLQDKRNFAKLLYQISKEDLGKVLVDVESKHPAAIKRNATEDEVVLNIDEIPGPLLKELQDFVSQAKGQKKKAPSSKANKKAKIGS